MSNDSLLGQPVPDKPSPARIKADFVSGVATVEVKVRPYTASPPDLKSPSLATSYPVGMFLEEWEESELN